MLNSYHPRVATDSSYHPSHDFHPMDPNHHYYHANDTYEAQDDRLERSLLLGGDKKKKKKKGNRHHHQQLETRSGSLILMAAHIITLTFASFLIYITRPYLESDIFNTLYLSWTALALSGVIILISFVALYQVYKFLWYAYPGNGLVLNHFLSMFLIIILCIYTGGILRYWQDDMSILEQEIKGINYKTWHALMGCGLILSHLIIMMGTLRVKFHDAIRVSIYKWTSFLASLIILSLCVVILFLTILVACQYGKNTDPHVSPLLHQVTVTPLSIFVYGIISCAFLLFSISIVGVAAPFYRPHAHVRILIWSLPILSFPLLGFAIPAYLYCHIDSGARPTCDNYFLLMSILMSIATQPFVLMGASAYYAWKRFAYRHKQIHTDFI